MFWCVLVSTISLTESIRYRHVQTHSCPGQGKNKVSSVRTGEEGNQLQTQMYLLPAYVGGLDTTLQVTRKCACVTIRDHVCG